MWLRRVARPELTRPQRRPAALGVVSRAGVAAGAGGEDGGFAGGEEGGRNEEDEFEAGGVDMVRGGIGWEDGGVESFGLLNLVDLDEGIGCFEYGKVRLFLFSDEV